MDIESHIGLLQTTFPESFERYPVVGQTEENLQAFMERTNLVLPPEILAFFKIANGLPVGSRGLDGISPTRRYRKRPKYRYPDVESVYSYLPEFQDAGWLPIGTDGCGSYYVIPLQGDFGPGFPVVFHDHENEYNPTYIVASGLEQFVKFLIEEEVMNATLPWGESNYPGWGWPFDKEAVLKRDPAILNFTGVRIPWEA